MTGGFIPPNRTLKDLEVDAELAHERVQRSVTHAKIRRAVESSIEFLSIGEVLDVSHFVVYRAYLVRRTKAVRDNKPVPTFEEFLVSFLEEKKAGR